MQYSTEILDKKVTLVDPLNTVVIQLRMPLNWKYIQGEGSFCIHCTY